jgi:hypothetical protein
MEVSAIAKGLKRMAKSVQRFLPTNARQNEESEQVSSSKCVELALDRRALLLALPTLTLGSAGWARAQGVEDQSQFANLPFVLRGRPVQGGFVTGVAAPRALIIVDGMERGQCSASGAFFVGLDRDAPKSCVIELIDGQSKAAAILNVATKTYDVQRVDGLPPQTVTPTDQKILERIKRETALKAAAFQSRIDDDWFKSGFIYPLKNFRVSGQFGNQRILNGVPKSPHMGFDMAAATGTPIFAPQDGRVVLAQSDMFYEGGLTFIDHGQGLIAMFLHQSKVLVRVGDTVAQGQKIGEVGAKGRATGPHLCWRLKWSGRYLNPALMVLS